MQFSFIIRSADTALFNCDPCDQQIVSEDAFRQHGFISCFDINSQQHWGRVNKKQLPPAHRVLVDHRGSCLQERKCQREQISSPKFAYLEMERDKAIAQKLHPILN
jgi:hypothetical protein